MSAMSNPDRAGRPAWQTAALVASVAVATSVAGFLSAQGRVSPPTGALIGACLGALAMVGLPSLSITQLARTLLLVSAAILVRFGLLGTGLTGGSQVVLLWMVAAVAVLVLSHQMTAERVDALGGSERSASPRGAGSTARTVAVIAGAAVLVVLLLGPLLLPHLGSATRPGRGASSRGDDGSGTSLRATDSLDMTTRPDLDDTVVFTVESDRATFWRGETFDLWDGRRWTRSAPEVDMLGSGGTVRVGDDDLAARGDDVLEQRITIEADYADVVYAAPSAVRVDIDRPVAQRPDGTLVSAALGQGATYTVTSRRVPLSTDRLRAVDGGETPDAILAQYAQPPVTTDRVRSLAPTIVEGADTRFDRIEAIQRWMGQRVEYSLDAPLAPEGVDVVDHFLFDAEQGWCEQIASSLVVLARANAIPARLVTGFVPGERDTVTGRWIVRAKQAHAWAEVWFPEVGWVPFDPTADVPLAGQESTGTPLLTWLLEHLVVIVLVVVAVALLVGPVRSWVRRRRGRAKAVAPEVTWATLADRRLAAEGERWDQPRAPSQTAAAHAATLALVAGDPRVVEVGRRIDDALYAPSPPTSDEQAEVDAVLAELAARPVPEPVAGDGAAPVGSSAT